LIEEKIPVDEEINAENTIVIKLLIAGMEQSGIANVVELYGA
jgi:hypothetical protein